MEKYPFLERVIGEANQGILRDYAAYFFATSIIGRLCIELYAMSKKGEIPYTDYIVDVFRTGSEQFLSVARNIDQHGNFEGIEEIIKKAPEKTPTDEDSGAKVE